MVEQTSLNEGPLGEPVCNSPLGANVSAALDIGGDAAEVSDPVAAEAQGPPPCISPNFAGMPTELKPLKNWVLWVPAWNGSKWTKRPIQPSGYGASSTNPKHWSSFEQYGEHMSVPRHSG